MTATNEQISGCVHRRYNPLTGEWVLVSPHRTKRPWQGMNEDVASARGVEYDPDCYLCPGNTRAGGKKNPEYTSTFVFDNDFSALLPAKDDCAIQEQNCEADSLFRSHRETGRCRVVCFSPRHDLTFARMQTQSICRVVEVWQQQFATLGEEDEISYVQIFENRGAIMGCSNPHPHGQIWANKTIPMLVLKETQMQKEYMDRHDRCLLCEYTARELETQERVICSNTHFVALVPFWAVWPFEVMVLPRHHIRDITEMSARHSEDFADIMHRMCVRYDNLFRTSFPYSMGIHQSPVDVVSHDEWHLHVHFYPPLLRSATVKKFMVGYEMLAQPQRDITAEEAARRLRECSEGHYLDA